MEKLELYYLIFQAWKVVEFKGGSWKVMQNYVHGTKSRRQLTLLE